MADRIYRMVEYSIERGGFFYQTTATSPLRGPFQTRASAIADALWERQS